MSVSIKRRGEIVRRIRRYVGNAVADLVDASDGLYQNDDGEPMTDEECDIAVAEAKRIADRLIASGRGAP